MRFEDKIAAGETQHDFRLDLEDGAQLEGVGSEPTLKILKNLRLPVIRTEWQALVVEYNNHIGDSHQMVINRLVAVVEGADGKEFEVDAGASQCYPLSTIEFGVDSSICTECGSKIVSQEMLKMHEGHPYCSSCCVED